MRERALCTQNFFLRCSMFLYALCLGHKKMAMAMETNGSSKTVAFAAAAADAAAAAAAAAFCFPHLLSRTTSKRHCNFLQPLFLFLFFYSLFQCYREISYAAVGGGCGGGGKCKRG